MLRILAVMLRNMKLMLRSRISALIVILGPLMLIFLAGIAFNTSSLYSINVAVYDPADTELSRSFISGIEDDFTTTYHESSSSCIESVRWGGSHICMVFPEDFVIENNKTNVITFYADTSKVNLIYMILDSVSSQVSSQTTELSAGMTDILLGAIENTREVLQNDASTLTRLGAKRSKALSETSDAQDTLDNLVLDTPDSGFDELKDGMDGFEDDINDLTDAGGDVISEFKSLMNSVENNAEDIIEELKDTNISDSDAEYILDMINESRDALNEIEDRLESAQEGALDGLDELADIVEDIGSNFNYVAQRLDRAKVGRRQVSENLAAITTALDESETLSKVISDNHNDLIARINAISVTSSESITRPITTRIQTVASEQSNLSYLYPSLIMLVVMFICLLLSSTMVIMERKSMATFRNFCTPTKDMSFTLGTYFTSLLITGIQVAIILGISAFVFKANFVPQVLPLTASLFLLLTLFILIGMAVGHLFGSEETVTLASISIGSLFLLMSDLILPMESMPANIAHIAGYNPFVIGSSMLKQIILFNFTFYQLMVSLRLLVIYIVGLFLLTVIIQKLVKQRFLLRYARFNVQANKDVSIKLEPTNPIVIAGKQLKTLGELSDALKHMSLNTFEQYRENHMFEDWVRRDWADPLLAGEIAKAKHQRHVARVLRKGHKIREKQKRRKSY